MRVTRPAVLRVLVVAVLWVVAGCGSQPAAVDRAEPSGSTPRARSVRVVAVGDIACPPGTRPHGTRCRQAATAAVARRFGPDLVLTLGDHQYQKGRLRAFSRSYDRSWGRLLSRTRPALGNHEYRTAGAKGYYTYFRHRQPGPPGYYRVAARGWNIYVLNSNCAEVDCSAEASWLDRQMSAHPSTCSLVTMHHPRYSSGSEHGNTRAVSGLWSVAYRHRNDIVLSGHDHDYERFRPMGLHGDVQRSRGMVEYVVGTGGRSLYRLGTRKAGSAYFQARTPGVLGLLLAPGRWSWGYRGLRGHTLDGGHRSCR